MEEGTQGLAEDIRYYGQWMRDEAEKRIGHLYPKIEVTAEMAKERSDLKSYIGKKLTVIAWLWARTVKSPNPAFADVDVPLASTFMLSTKVMKEAYVDPVIEGSGYRFAVKIGKPKDEEGAKKGTSAGKRAAFKCVMSGIPITYDYIRSEGQSGRIGARLMAIVAEGEHGRIYISPTPGHETIAFMAKPEWKPDTPLEGKSRVNVSNYGLDTFGDLFTSRQLVALTVFSDLVQEVRERVMHDAFFVGLGDDGKHLRDGAVGATAYAEAVGVYLGFAIDKLTKTMNTVCTWQTDRTRLVAAFRRQAIPMTWDYAEPNAFLDATGHFYFPVLSDTEEMLGFLVRGAGQASQNDAAIQTLSTDRIISTDPPYYDNIGYADLSDFFYVWLRRSLRSIFPDLCSAHSQFLRKRS